MWKERVRSYFTFSKADRLTIPILLLLILCINTLPPLLSDYFYQPISPELVAAIPESSPNDSAAAPVTEEEPISATPAFNTPLQYHAFDPNTASKAELTAMGFANASIQHLLHHRNKFPFRYKEDLKRINGIDSLTYLELAAYIQLPEKPIYKPFTSTPFTAKSPKPIQLVDINTADTSTWIALPYIGSKMARRIVAYRTKLGGFIKLEQVKEVYGFSDSTFLLLQNRLQLSSENVNTLNPNTADYATLKAHPYIGAALAQAIVNFRQQHGPFKTCDELLQIRIIDQTRLAKLRPYLKTD